MNDKTMLAFTLSELGSNSYLSMSECEKFGMTFGCREDCPVFERGECELQEELEENFKEE